MKLILKSIDQSLDGKPTGLETTVQTEIITLTEALEAFELLLRGSGFHFDGSLDIVKEE